MFKTLREQSMCHWEHRRFFVGFEALRAVSVNLPRQDTTPLHYRASERRIADVIRSTASFAFGNALMVA